MEENLAEGLGDILDADVAADLAAVVSSVSDAMDTPAPPTPPAPKIADNYAKDILAKWLTGATEGRDVLLHRAAAFERVNIDNIRMAGGPLANMSAMQHRCGEFDRVVIVNWTDSTRRLGQIVPIRNGTPGYAVSGFGQGRWT